MTKACEHVWGLVCGVAGETNRRNRVLVVLKAFVDESADGLGQKTFVLAGYVSSAEKWASLSDEWSDHSKTHHQGSEFKMKKSWNNARKVEAYYSLIEKYVISSFACVLNINDLHSVLNSTPVPQGKEHFWKTLRNPYFLATRSIMQHLTANLGKIGISDPIDFVFDDKSEKQTVIDGWDHFKSSAPGHIEKGLGGSLTFGDSKKLMPLQAADLIAGLIQRYETTKGEWRGQIPYKINRNIEMLLILPSKDSIKRELEWIISPENEAAARVFPKEKAVLSFLKGLKEKSH